MASPTEPTSLIPTVSIWGPADNVSVVSGVEEPSEVEEVVEVEEIRVLTVGFRAALRSLDDLNLSGIFQRRAVVMKTSPHFLRGPFWNATKVGVGGDHRRFRESECAQTGTGMEGVLVVAQVASPQKMLGRKDWQGEVERPFRGFSCW